MRKPIRSALIGLTAAFLFLLAVDSASAGHLSFSSRAFRLVWATIVCFGEGTGATENSITCPITLEGSFHSTTLAKVIGALIGHITRAMFGESRCQGGSASILQSSLPWHVTYEGFTGTLPRISSIRLLLRTMAFVAEASGGLGTKCLYRETGNSGAGELEVEPNGALTGMRIDETIRLPLIRSEGIGGFACPSESGFMGTTDTTTVLGSTAKITVRLI